MPRIRNIKPDCFTDADVNALPPLHRWFLPALWCHADRDGRLEDKPRELKVKCLPYDECDADAMLWDLHSAGFIVRYEVDGKRYIQVPNFTEHQRFHKDEKSRELPGPGVGTVLAPPQHRANTTLARIDGDRHETGTRGAEVPAALVSEAGSLKSEAGNPEPPRVAAAGTVSAMCGTSVPVIAQTAQPTRRVEDLRDAMEKLWRLKRGSDPAPGWWDEFHVRAAFDKSGGDPSRLLRVYSQALDSTYPTLARLADLPKWWDSFAATKKPEKRSANARATQEDRVDADYQPPLTEDGNLDLMGAGS